MAYMEIDAFTDEQKAKVRAAKLRKEGRRNVKLTKASVVTVYDFSVEPPKLEFEKESTVAVHIVQSEGD